MKNKQKTFVELYNLFTEHERSHAMQASTYYDEDLGLMYVRMSLPTKQGRQSIDIGIYQMYTEPQAGVGEAKMLDVTNNAYVSYIFEATFNEDEDQDEENTLTVKLKAPFMELYGNDISTPPRENEFALKHVIDSIDINGEYTYLANRKVVSTTELYLMCVYAHCRKLEKITFNTLEYDMKQLKLILFFNCNYELYEALFNNKIISAPTDKIEEISRASDCFINCSSQEWLKLHEFIDKYKTTIKPHHIKAKIEFCDLSSAILK